MKCKNCGFENPETMKFCGNCGKPMLIMHEAQEEFRSLAILFMDMVGFTKFSESMDPEILKDILLKYYENIENAITFYEGEVIKYIGDGILSVFGYPKSHENDSERAVLAAFMSRDNIRELNNKMGLDIKFRYGINYGKVVASRVRNNMDFFGDEINICQRIQAAADPEQLLVSHEVYNQLKSIFDFKSRVKKADITDNLQIDVYAVNKKLKKRGKTRGIEGITHPMIGRQAEFNTLMDSFKDSYLNRNFHVQVIEGEAGIGKTRLYDEFESQVRKYDDIMIMKGRCLPYAKGFSYWPILEITKEYFQISENDIKEDVEAKLDEALIDLPDRESLHLIDIKSLFLNFLGFLESENLTVPLDKIQRSFFIVFSDLIRNISKRKMILFVIEDLHWIDISSRDLLLYITENLSDIRIFFIFITRMEAKENPVSTLLYDRTKDLPGFNSIKLERLNNSYSMELVEKILEFQSLPQNFKDLIISKSSGNPYFVEEIIKTFIDEGVLVRKGKSWKATRPVNEIDIPSSVKGVIQTRLDRLSEGEKKTIQNAAVIGNTFWSDILNLVTEQIVDKHLKSLESKNFVVKNYDSDYLDELEYLFKHILIREVAYNGILSKVKRVIHEKIAGIIEERFEKNDKYLALLSYHFEKAEIYDKAAQYYLKLGISQRSKNLNEDAIYSLGKVLDYKKFIDFRDEYTALDNIGKIKIIQSKNREAIAIYKKLLNSKKISQREIAETMCKIAEIYQRISEFAIAEEFLQEIRKILKPEWHTEQVSYKSLAAWISYLKGDIESFKSAAEDVRELLKASRKLSDEKARDIIALQSYSLFGVYYDVLNDKKEALKYYKKIENYYKSRNKYLYLDACYNNIGTLYFAMGELGRAIDYFKRSLDICYKMQDKLGETVTCYNIGNIYNFCNYPEKAEEYFRRYLEINQEIDNVLGNGYGKSGLASLAMRNEEYDRAIELLMEAKSIFNRLGSKSLEEDIDIQLIEAYIEMGKLAIAENLLLKINKQSRPDDHKFLYGKLLLKKGKYSEAVNTFRYIYDRDLSKKDGDHLLISGYYLLKACEMCGNLKPEKSVILSLKKRVNSITEKLSAELKDRFLQDRKIRYIISYGV